MKPTDTQSRTVLRPLQAAEYLNISRSFLYKLIKDGQIARLKLGGRASGFLRADLDAWLLKQREAATAA
ncbi:helix-turn-helix transcriptional regulator [Inhella proteolytica]|uniref:Helix-turn-helix domain-containing protein n=1 Tax=Inhella proteolytica TaxID=2795029 RepID=A0A931J3Y6_9BURK|nr:excisionase family DNA-binding protein [Inhella proteolytica]MBH9577765.1 helix-turn-helix domain-containing protein [Inhella proteolytica]